MKQYPERGWKISLIAGLWFSLGTIGLTQWMHYSAPGTYGTDLYMRSIYTLSSMIAGGYFGSLIYKASCKKNPCSLLIKAGIFIFISEIVLMSIFSSLLSFYFRGDFRYALFGLIAMVPLYLSYYGFWKIFQLIMSVFFLYLGFKTKVG